MINPNEEQFELLQKKIKELLEESNGETIYDIGVGQGKLLKN